MLQPEYTNQFKKDIKNIQKRNLNMELMKKIINMLCNEEVLPARYKDHVLTGNWGECRDCHIRADWILIYRIGNGIIVFERTGSHSDLF